MKNGRDSLSRVFKAKHAWGTVYRGCNVAKLLRGEVLKDQDWSPDRLSIDRLGTLGATSTPVPRNNRQPNYSVDSMGCRG